MAAQVEKNDTTFDLIKSMSKAEKRNFKLYVKRLSGNQESKFLTLFDFLDNAEEYDEERILAKCPISKSQIANTKAHLSKQILISLRMLKVQHNPSMQVREGVEFARILYDRGLFKQSEKMLEKLKEQAIRMNMPTTTLEILEFLRHIDINYYSKDIAPNIGMMDAIVDNTCESISRISELSSTSIRLLSLHQKLGYARSQKDIDLIITYFTPRLECYKDKKLSFVENFYYYQAQVWYYYILHDFVSCYRYTLKWTRLFEEHPIMKTLRYDNYIKGYARLIDGLYLMKKYKQFCEILRKIESEGEYLTTLNLNAEIITHQVIYINRLHKCLLDGNFNEGLLIVKDIDNFITTKGKYIGTHQKMLLQYKVACLYFGKGNYEECITYLEKIIEIRDPQIRRDLQCYARILKLLASYEAGIDQNIEYQIRSVYTYLVKMNDMHKVQTEMLQFIKNLNNIYEQDLKQELKKLYDRLKVYETDPYERRTFYYLDILTWLESKITGLSIGSIISNRLKSGEVK